MLEAVLSTILFTSLIWFVYHHVGYDNLKHCYSYWFKDGYWTNYNIVEAVAWLSKALVIIPALLWGQEIWWLHIITLVTSAALIWVSERKLLPTLVAFNTLWIIISSIVIVRHFV